MKTTYKVIENPPYDRGAPSTFWIRKETVRFGIFKSYETIGDYKYDDTYGELGDCPFFSRTAANKRVKLLKQ